MQTGMPQCQPTLLEPITHIEVNAQRIYVQATGERTSGQILGYEARGDWQGWDKVTAYLIRGDAQLYCGSAIAHSGRRIFPLAV